MHRHGAGGVLSSGQVGEGLLCSKLAIPPGGCLVHSFPATLPEGPESPRLLLHLWERQTHCGGWGRGGHGAHGQLVGSGLGRERGPARDHTPWLVSLAAAPSRGHNPGQRKAGNGGWGCRESVSIEEAPGPPAGPPAGGAWVLAYRILWGHSGPPLRGGKKGPETPPPQLREWRKAGEPMTAVYY